MLNRGLASLTPDAIVAALSVPVERGSVVFIGAPWLLADPLMRQVKAFHVAASAGEGW